MIQINISWFKNLKNKRSISIFCGAVLFRIMIYLVSVCVMAMFGEYQEGITFSDFLTAWQRWDASAYLRIAQNGYKGYQEAGQFLDIVFFPLYPWLIKVVALLIGNYQMAGIMVSVICYGIGNVYFDKLLCLEFDQETAENATLMLAVFPFSFFFGAIMTESLFFAIIAAFFYYLRKHKWQKVSVIGFLACMTKLQGMLLALAVIAEMFYSYHGISLIRQKRWKDFVKDVILNGLKCVPMVGGALVYLLMNYIVEGDPFRFMYYQEHHWMHTLGPIWDTFAYIKDYTLDSFHTSTGMSLWVPQFVLFFVYLIAILYGFIKKMCPTYLTYLIAFFLLTYSSTWLISGGRYTLSAMPLFILAGQFCTEHKKAKAILAPLSFALMIVYMVGYYQWKQIM